MPTTTQKPTSLPPKLVGMEHFSPHFKGNSTEIAKKGVEIAHLQAAEKIQQLFAWAKKDVRVGGLSLEDMAGRLQTLIGVYLLQGYFAVKHEKHPWETNGRNAIVWLMTLALTSITKSENYGVNTILFNPFMKQKGAAIRLFPFLRPLLDKARMDVDYLDIIQAAGIKIRDSEKTAALKGTKALWASSWLDDNKMKKIENHLIQLVHKGETASDAEKAMRQAIPKFFNRINAFNLASTGIITAATVYFIGGVAMRIVNKFISPLDKDFDEHKKQKNLSALPLGTHLFPSQVLQSSPNLINPGRGVLSPPYPSPPIYQPPYQPGRPIRFSAPAYPVSRSIIFNGLGGMN
jgi:hypothetical protein